MAQVHEVLQCMQALAPTALAEEWDNVGLLVDAQRAGDILLTLDITHAVIDDAVKNGYAIIVSHHPVIFAGQSRLAKTDVVYRLIENGLSAICMHTNLDAADGGVNDALANALGLCEVKRLNAAGARMGTLQSPMCASALAQLCAQRLSAHVQYVDAAKPITTLALLGGAGKAYLQDAINAHADAFLTGEAGHHTALEALEAGVSLFAAGHFATEYPVLAPLANRLTQAFADTRVSVSAAAQNPFAYV